MSDDAPDYRQDIDLTALTITTYFPDGSVGREHFHDRLSLLAVLSPEVRESIDDQTDARSVVNDRDASG